MDHDREFNSKKQSPFLTGYPPELGTSPELDQDNTNYLQGRIEWFQPQTIKIN